MNAGSSLELVLKESWHSISFLYCIVYISLFQFSWVQYNEFQIIFSYNFFEYNQYELRVPFRLIFEGFDTRHPIWYKLGQNANNKLAVNYNFEFFKLVC